MTTAAKTVLGFTLPQIVDIVGTMASAFIPGATVLGFTVTQLANIAKGVADGIPDAIALVDQIKAASAPGAPKPTPEQWEIWNTAADEMHASIQEAAARVIRDGH